jgi:alginate O-acetyltransferase complex protein AlgJ
MSLGNLPRVSGLLRDGAALLREKGIEVGFIVVPSKYRIYRDMLPPGHGFMDIAENRLSLILEELRRGSPLVPDLAAALLAQRLASPRDNLFFKADTHWTPAGAASAAAEVNRQIRTAVRLPASRAPGVRLAPAVTQTRLRRDLLDFLPPADRGAHPPEAYQVRLPVAARGALLDAPVSDITVVGNSFMAPEFNFHNELSALLERPVALEWQVQTVGPFKTMLDYLNGQLFRRERPRLVLWTVLENVMTINPENRGAYPESHMTGAAFLDGIRQALARI